MAWLLVLVVVAFVAAPVVWMMPSKAQQRQVAMREAARKAGLQVRIGPLPQTQRQQVRQEDKRNAVCYGLLLKRDNRAAAEEWLVWREDDEDDQRSLHAPAAAREAALALLAKYDTVRCLERNELGLWLWWFERGEPPLVADLAEALMALAESQGYEQPR